jgi:hypothetical protein
MIIENIGFVWIPKTGGSDLTEYFIKHCKNIIPPTNKHKTTGKNYNIPCFTILREPIERFVSAFKFLSYAKFYEQYIHDDEYNIKINYNNINDYLDNISDDELLKNVFFKHQYNWLNNNDMYIVKYDSKNTYKNIIPMLKNVFGINVDYNIINDEKMNVSVDTSGLQCEFTSYNIERLQRLYKKDYDYYNIFNSNNITYYQLRDFCSINY